MNIADAVLVRVAIKTKDLHGAAPRQAAIVNAQAQARAVGHRVVGEAEIEGNLAGEWVQLVWLASRD